MSSDYQFAVRVLPSTIAKPLIIKYHYSHTWPCNYVSFGGFVNGQLVGIITYGSSSNPMNWKSVPGCTKIKELMELTRLWVSDGAPRFIESRLISKTVRIIKKKKLCRVLVSYADPKEGHVGTVYQASNWIYLGQGRPNAKIKINGKMLHTRSVFATYGTIKQETLRQIIPDVEFLSVEANHKYVYPIDTSLTAGLRAISKPYPKPARRG